MPRYFPTLCLIKQRFIQQEQPQHHQLLTKQQKLHLQQNYRHFSPVKPLLQTSKIVDATRISDGKEVSNIQRQSITYTNSSSDIIQSHEAALIMEPISIFPQDHCRPSVTRSFSQSVGTFTESGNDIPGCNGCTKITQWLTSDEGDHINEDSNGDGSEFLSFNAANSCVRPSCSFKGKDNLFFYFFIYL